MSTSAPFSASSADAIVGVVVIVVGPDKVGGSHLNLIRALDGHDGPAASWIGIAKSIEGTLTAVTLDARGAPAETIVEGSGGAIIERVMRATADGTLVRLYVQP
jgi:hypothetical protein